MATIRKRANGTWQAIIRKTGFKAQSKTFTTKRLATDWAKGHEAEIQNGSAPDVSALRKETVGALFERFRDEVCPKRLHGKREIPALDRLLKHDLALVRLDQDIAEALRKYTEKRSAVVAAGTVLRELSLIGGVFSVAIKKWGVPLKVSPYTLIEKPSAPRGRDTTWTSEDIAELFKKIGPVDFPPKELKDYVPVVVELALETAMRRGEILESFTAADCHLDEAWLRLEKTKNGDKRDVPLSKRAIEILRPFVKIAGDKPVFPVAPNSIQRTVTEAKASIGLGHKRFHDLRHTAATNLSTKLSNVLELSAVTGHRSLQSLKRYYNPKASDLAAKLG